MSFVNIWRITVDFSARECMAKGISLARALDIIASSGGGCLTVESGVWSTGPLTIKSNTGLVLEKGAVLSFIPDFSLYRPVFTRWEGVDCYAMHPCILVDHAQNAYVSGEGTIDGSGKIWWQEVARKKEGSACPESELEKELASLNPGYESQPGGGGGRPSQFLRPPLLSLNGCSDVYVNGVRLENSPFWTLHVLYSRRIEIKNVSIRNPSDSPNTDGIDIDSSEDVMVAEAEVDVGDDGIAIKSGSGASGIAAGRPSRNIAIEKCTVYSAHGGISIGSETAAGIDNVTVSSCRFIGTDRGIRIKTRRGRGGIVENLRFSDITISDALCPVAVNMFYKCGCDDEKLFSLSPLPIRSDTPVVRNISFASIRASGCRSSVGFIAGLPEMPATGIELKNCSFALAEKPDVPVSKSEMTQGLAKIEERSFRLCFCSVKAVDVDISGVDTPYCIEQGVQLEQ